jgi:ABC-type transporter MlaC component
MAEAQRQQVTESFGRYISAIYADRFDSDDGQKLEVTGEEPAAAGLMVRSRIVKANGELPCAGNPRKTPKPTRQLVDGRDEPRRAGP